MIAYPAVEVGRRHLYNFSSRTAAWGFVHKNAESNGGIAPNPKKYGGKHYETKNQLRPKAKIHIKRQGYVLPRQLRMSLPAPKP